MLEIINSELVCCRLHMCVKSPRTFQHITGLGEVWVAEEYYCICSHVRPCTLVRPVTQMSRSTSHYLPSVTEIHFSPSYKPFISPLKDTECGGIVLQAACSKFYVKRAENEWDIQGGRTRVPGRTWVMGANTVYDVDLASGITVVTDVT